MTRSDVNGIRVLRSLGAVIAASGGVAIFVGLGLDNWICQSLGLVAAIAGVLLMRLHLVRRKFPGASDVSVDGSHAYSELSRRPGVLAWVCAVGSTLACLASFGAMYVDAGYGGHWVWPVYAVAATGIACACAWGYIAAKMGWFVPY